MDVKFVSGRSVTWDDSLYPNTELALTNNYDLGKAESRISSVIAPYLDGECYYNQTLAPRDILLEYVIIENTIAARDALVQTIKTAFNPVDGLGLLTLTMADGITKYAIWCIPNGEPQCFAGDGRTREGSGVGTFKQVVQVNLRAPIPFFMNPVPHTVNISTFSGGLAFPFATPWTFGLASSSILLTNAGNVSTPVKITFNGSITNPRIDNITTGKYIKATMTLNSGETLEIDTAQGDHTVDYTVGGTTSNGFQYLDSASEFFLLQPGANLLSFTASTSIGVSASCTIEYYDLYLGV